MQYCRTCHVYIRGGKERCILCGNALQAEKEETTEQIFPKIPLDYKRYLLVRILLFISCTAMVVSFAVRTAFPTEVNWPEYVALGLFSLWLCLLVLLWKRHYPLKTILWQTAVVSGLALFWDRLTGWNGWSLDYVIPGVLLSAEIALYVAAKIRKLYIREYVTYILLGSLLGIAPIAFFLLEWLGNPYPSILCAAASLVFLSAILIFRGEYIKRELNRRMHL